MKIWNKQIQNIYDTASQTVWTEIIFPTLKLFKGKQKVELYVKS